MKSGSMQAPEFFLGFHGAMPLDTPNGKSPSQDLVLAVASDTPAAIGTRKAAFIDATIAAIGPAEVQRCNMPWGQPLSGGVLNPIPDWFGSRGYER